jgi:MYXO-CTERM domain-containing protein
MRTFAAIVVAAATVASSNLVHARERMDRGYVVTPAEDRSPGTGAVGPGHIIYFNRQGGQFTYSNSQIDSRTNKNNIGSGNLSPFNCGDAAWNQVMTCLRETFAPYNVEVTDVEPPSSMQYSECVVAGTPGQIGQSNGVAGIAPLGCGLWIDNPVAFAFANVLQCDVNEICWTAAQEIAHAWGLDHEIDCRDPMTYDGSCGNPKRFVDADIQCGEYPSPQYYHECACTNAQRQNSHQTLLSIFGPRNDVAPSVQITSPSDGGTIQIGASVYVTATDDIRVALVQLFVDGNAYAQTDIGGPSFTFTLGQDVAPGSHTLTARATDPGGKTADHSIQVTIEGPCTGNDDCDDGQVCNISSGQCVAGPGMEGGLGSECTDNAQCDSGICATGPDGTRCVSTCTPGGTDCPDGFDCLNAGSSGACWPSADVLEGGDGGGPCGCRAGRRDQSGVWGGVLFALAALVAVRRRR